MKSFYQKVALLSGILFILGVFVVAYVQYAAPERIAEGLHISAPGQLAVVRNLVNSVGLITGIELLVGLLAVVLLLNQHQQARRAIRMSQQKATSEEAHQGQRTEETEDKSLQTRLLNVSQVMQQRFDKPELLLEKVLSTACREVEASQAALYVAEHQDEKRVIRLITGYAFSQPESRTLVYEFGEGLAGQAVKEGKPISIKEVPQGYITILSGLGKASPNALLLVPIGYEEQVVGLLEVASFHAFTASDEKFLLETGALLGKQLASMSQLTAMEATEGLAEA